MLEIVHVLYHNKSLIIGNFSHVHIDPRVLLLNRISPPEMFDRGEVIPRVFTIRIGNRKRRFRGFFIAEDESIIQQFLLRHGVNSTEIRRILRNSCVFVYREPYTVEWRGRTYAFEKGSDSGILYGWDRRDGHIYPVIAGWIDGRHKNYFYLHRIDVARNIARFRFVPDPGRIPQTVISPLSDGFIFSSLQIDEKIDIIPFPPFKTKYALRLYSPRMLLKSRDEQLPGEFKEPFIVKTFLPVSEGVRVIDVSPGVVRSFVKNINGHVYAPSNLNPHWEADYRELWKRTAGYVLLCKPEPFFEKMVV